MDYKDLTPEQKEKLLGCKTPEDLLALAKAEGYELSDAELDAVSGGSSWLGSCNGNVCDSYGEIVC